MEEELDESKQPKDIKSKSSRDGVGLNTSNKHR